MKHFTNLTPRQSNGIAAQSDQPDVLISAFSKGNSLIVHIANLGPQRRASLAGLPSGKWRQVLTSESIDWQEQALDTAAPIELPARSLLTLIRE